MFNRSSAKQVTPERVIEAEILYWLTYKGIFAWKNISGGFYDPAKKAFRRQASRFAINGTSDILAILPNGRFLAIEVKSSSGVVSEHQKAFLSKINANGGLAFVARSLLDVQNQLKDLTNT